MSNSFVPLPSAPSFDASPAAFDLKVLAQAASRPLFEALPGSGPGHQTEACAKPIVTLQRHGEIVTGIRIQCGCGQVVELSCVY